jgi:hypothetical protein
MNLTERQDLLDRVLASLGQDCTELAIRLVIFFGLAVIIMTSTDWIPFILTYFDRWF